MRRLLVVAVVVASLFGAAACSSATEQVQDKIQKQVREQTGVTSATVTCDKGLEAKKGSKGTCTAKGDFTSFVKKVVGATYTGPTKLSSLKFDVVFTADDTFSATVNEAQVVKDLTKENNLPSADDTSGAASGDLSAAS